MKPVNISIQLTPEEIDALKTGDEITRQVDTNVFVTMRHQKFERRDLRDVLRAAKLARDTKQAAKPAEEEKGITMSKEEEKAPEVCDSLPTPEAAPEAAEPVKRKRGRPRKVVSEVNADTPAEPKRKRGRPRKVVITEATAE